MSKQRFFKILEEIRKTFADDLEVRQAVELLRTKVEGLEFSPSTKESKSPLSGMPIPAELERDSSALAIFSDGACRGNPGPGAWGALGQNAQAEILFESNGMEMLTTNNRMELMGAIESIKRIREYMEAEGLRLSHPVHLYSDSKYLIDGINQWIEGWKNRGWKKADGKAPENLELWKELDQLKQVLKGISFHWVKGHAGHPQNEQCDLLANMALDSSGY